MAKHDPNLDLDDAFSDSEDRPNEFQFSSRIIREDFARISNEPKGEFRELNNSVSTLNIDEPDIQSPQDESELSATFDEISLSTSHIASEELADSYPNVLIDASKPPGHRVTLSSEANQTPIGLSSPPRSSSDHSSPLQSSQSLPTPRQEHYNGNGNNTAASDTSRSVSPVPSTSQSNSAPPKKTQRPARSVGPSALERFRSKTRPSFLPPKSRTEDDKHMADWQSMMKYSRAAAEKRRKALQERRLAREKNIEESLSVWEKEIVPDWRVVNKNPNLRKLWWKGIPSKLRASMWEHAVGNPLALSKDNYRSCLARAKRALSAGTFPAATLSMIEDDIATTLPALHIFHHETGPLYPDLKDMLCAWVVSRTDEGLGYKPGASRIAAMLIINMPVQQAFVAMRNLLERHCLRSFYGGDGAKNDVEGYYRIFDTLLADGMPKIYFNFKQHQISPASYLPDWLISLFLDHLPFEACSRVWDVLLLEGDSFLYRAALGMLAVLEPRLFFPEKKELLELLRGENKAALDVARREGRPLDGGKYEIYGVDEETLWERIDNMEDWWKESTWNRLIQRELPDL